MNGFGEGEGELLTLHYPKPLPMRLDRWLVSQRPEQSRARIQKFIEAGYVRVNGTTGRAKTPLRTGDEIKLWMPPPEPLPYLQPEPMDLDVLFEDEHLIDQQTSRADGASSAGEQRRNLGERVASPLPRLTGHQRQAAAWNRAPAR